MLPQAALKGIAADVGPGVAGESAVIAGDVGGVAAYGEVVGLAGAD